MLVPKRDPAATGPTNPFEVTSDGQSGEESDPAAAGSHSTFSLSGEAATGGAGEAGRAISCLLQPVRRRRREPAGVVVEPPGAERHVDLHQTTDVLGHDRLV